MFRNESFQQPDSLDDVVIADEEDDEQCADAALAGAADATDKPVDAQVNRPAIFAIIALALMMMSINSTIVATALHALQQGLGTTINWVGWTITAYSFGFVLMLPISGKLSEQYGRRRVFVASVIVFTLASLLCGFANNIYTLIGLRVLQAAGGAGFTPSATGIIVDYFGDQRDRAVGLFGSIFPVGAMIGPIFGGLFVAYWSWRGIFWVNVPLGIAIVFLVRHYIPADRDDPGRQRDRMDLRGMGLLGIGLLLGMFAVSYVGEPGVSLLSPLFIAPLLAAGMVTWLFFRHVRRAGQPFIEPQLIYGRGFGDVNLINVVLGGLLGGITALIPLYAANRYGIDALRSGTLLIAQGAAAFSLSAIAAMVLRRTGYRLPMHVGGAIAAAGMVLLAVAPHWGITPYAWLAGAAFLVGAGSGTLNPASRNAGLQLAPDHSSTLAALRSMAMQVGSISTIAVVTAVLASSDDLGHTQAGICVVAGVLLLASQGLIRRVPEHRGAW